MEENIENQTNWKMCLRGGTFVSQLSAHGIDHSRKSFKQVRFNESSDRILMATRQLL